MKKLVMFGVCNALLLSMSIGTPILTSGSFTQKQAEPIKNMCLYDSKNNICKKYSDADHDGICDNWLLFTHKLDTCCQAMCQEHKTAKNPAFRQRRIINRLDSVTVRTAGVNSNDNCHNISHNKNHHTTNKKTNTYRVTSPKSHHSENHNHNNHHR